MFLRGRPSFKALCNLKKSDQVDLDVPEEEPRLAARNSYSVNRIKVILPNNPPVNVRQAAMKGSLKCARDRKYALQQGQQNWKKVYSLEQQSNRFVQWRDELLCKKH